MPTLTTLRPGAANTTGLPTTGSILANPGGSTALSDDSDSTFDGQNTNSSGTYQYGRELADMPSDFGSMDSGLTIQFRRAWESAPSNSTWDSLGARIVASNGTTILAAATAGGAFKTTSSSITDTTPTTASAVTFDYVNTSATKTQWDGAILQVQWVRTRSKGGDALGCRVYEAYVDGTYTVGAVSFTGSTTVATSTGTGTLTATHAFTGSTTVATDAPVGVGHLALDESAGTIADTSDKAQLDITGDIEVIVCVALDDWASASGDYFVNKFNGSATNRSYALGKNSTDRLEFAWSDGTSTFFQVPGNTIATETSRANGEHLWLRATLDVDNGSTQHEVRYYWSTDAIDTAPGSVSWTEWTGSPDTIAGTTSINASAETLEVGRFSAGSGGEMPGKVYGVWIYDGIGGTLVADPDWRTSDVTTDSSGNTWTKQGNATFVAGAGGTITTTPGTVTVLGAADLPGTGAFAASADVTAYGAADLAGAGAFAASATVTQTVQGAADLAGAGAFASTSSVRVAGAADLAGTGAFASSSTVTANGAADLPGTGTIAASADVTAKGAADLPGTGTVAASGTVRVYGAADLPGSGTFTADAIIGTLGAADLAGTGAFASSSTVTANGAADLPGSGAIASSSTVTAYGAADLPGTAVFDAVATTSNVVSGAADLAGAGAFAASATTVANGAADLAGTGAFAGQATVAVYGAADVAGAGTFDAVAAAPSTNGAADLAGTGTIAASGVVTVYAAGDLAGTGTIATDAQVVVYGTADLPGTALFAAAGRVDTDAFDPVVVYATFGLQTAVDGAAAVSTVTGTTQRETV